MRLTDYAPRPAQLKWLLTLTRPSAGRSCATSAAKPPTRLQPSVPASQAKAGELSCSPYNLLAVTGAAQCQPTSVSTCPGRPRHALQLLYARRLDGPRTRSLGEPARKMIDRVKNGLVFKGLKNRPFLQGETEPCINGRILALGAYFNQPSDALARRLVGEQLEDGGWNCEAPKSRRSSFHTTICVLDGLLAYERAGRKSAAITKARKRGENYLLERAHVPFASNWRSHQQTLAPLLVPHVLALRRLARTRLPAPRRNQSRQPSRGCHRSRNKAPPPERPLASQPSSSRTNPNRHGDRCRKRQPMEHPARPPRSALV